jgi:NAD(P)-dependent dehydrogenase (short-subunit alcohol dehydrogenase family)
MPSTVLVTGAGALGRAYVRALVANGHTVRVVDKYAGTIRAFAAIPDNPYSLPGPDAVRDIDIVSMDLVAPRERALNQLLEGVDAVVMTAANPLPFQSEESAAANHRMDVNTIDAALAAGARVVIYTSSVWRISGLFEGDGPVRPEMSAPRAHYGESKQATWEAMRARAARNPGVQFVVNDHGWYPREAMGAPPTNVADRGLQTWVAETETQQHVLRQIELPGRTDLSGNFHGFIVASRNIPSLEAVRHGHRPFILDLSTSVRLGVVHRANVYDLYAQYRLWRDVPIFME